MDKTNPKQFLQDSNSSWIFWWEPIFSWPWGWRSDSRKWFGTLHQKGVVLRILNVTDFIPKPF